MSRVHVVEGKTNFGSASGFSSTDQTVFTACS
jgi:hypothetical protein